MKGIVEIDIPESCNSCPLCTKRMVIGWNDYINCAGLKYSIDVFNDRGSDNPDDWITFDYEKERYDGCPIKRIKCDEI